MNITLNGRYKIEKKIGEGGFSEVFIAKDLKDPTKNLIAKLEPSNTWYPHVFYEARIYESLKDLRGIPTMIKSGPEGDFNYIIMERLGTNLNCLLQECGGRFQLQNVILLAGQMLNLLEELHKKQ